VKRIASALAIVLALSAACRRSSGPDTSGARRDHAASPAPVEPHEPPAPPEPLEPREPREPREPLLSIGFHNPRQLNEHFEKHGAEFGNVSRAEYLARAQRLRDAPLDRNVIEIVRADGVITRFDRASGAFIAFDRDRTIRTFFRPNDGEAYFRRQARR
jgi:hypothetical protein